MVVSGCKSCLGYFLGIFVWVVLGLFYVFFFFFKGVLGFLGCLRVFRVFVGFRVQGFRV